MTPEIHPLDDKAAAVVEYPTAGGNVGIWWHGSPVGGHLPRAGEKLFLEATVKELIDAAVTAERAACAEICDYYATALDHGDNEYLRSWEAAQAAIRIRQRGAA